MPSRFHRIRAATFALAACAIAACDNDPTRSGPTQEIIDDATIELHRPTGPTETITAGLHPLGLAVERDGFLYVPANYDPAVPAPLLVLLHGAGGSSADWDTPGLRTEYDANGLLVLAIDSRYSTWDVRVTGEYNVDVDFLQQALEYAYRVANVDPDRMGIGGFSDGASEAIGLGITNAHLFSRVLAYSPGFLYAPFARGYPEFYVTHGVLDEVIPFSFARDNIVLGLVRGGHQVIFRQFDDGHLIPGEFVPQSMSWAAGERLPPA